MDWFKKLEKNEQKLVKYGAIIIGLAISWLFIYQPISKTNKSKQIVVSTLEKQLKEMNSSKQKLSSSSHISQSHFRDKNKPFVAWIDGQLASNKLSDNLTRSEPKDNKTLILNFENVVFDKLITWLEPLETKFNVKILEADINLTDKSSGLCNARITLEDSI